MELITTSNADRNLAAGATVLSVTPDASNPRLCYALIKLGDGTKNLDGTGGSFTVTVTVGGNSLLGGGESYSVGTAVRTALQTAAFCVPANQAVTIAITSPNAADTDVDCTAYLMADEPLSAVVAALPTAAGVADAVWDEATSGHATAGTFGLAAGTIPAASATATAVLAAGDVDGYSLENALKLMLAALAGKVSGAGTTTVVIRAADDSKPRITATVETANGNRSALTLDATG